VKKPQILAPVGNWSMLTAALNAGADEVYFGVDSLNMRVGTKQNFLLSDLPEIVSKCKTKGVKTNLTMNIVMFDEDLKTAYITIDEAKKAGVDNIIAMDFAVILYAFKQGLEVHASVQAGITNFESAKFYAQYCDRIVLARECNLEQQKDIIKLINLHKIHGPKGKILEVEVFVHGALCVSISGKCGMSLLANNQSASRGRCTQPCRHKYEVIDVETGQKFEVDNQYVMSSGDLATIGFFDELLATGVDVLKIEGRGKNPEYVDMTVRTYKEAVESVLSSSYTLEKIKNWQANLEKVYNRKLTQGYYLGKDVKEWSGAGGSLATEKKLYVGDITRIFPKINVFEVKAVSTQFKIGDELLIIGDESGVFRIPVKSMRNENGQDILESPKGEFVSIETQEDRLKVKDKVYVILKR
jgi:putative protease